MLTWNINGKTKHDLVEHNLNMTKTRIIGYKTGLMGEHVLEQSQSEHAHKKTQSTILSMPITQLLQ